MSLRAYPEYKPGGAAWLQQVPGHWGLRSLKRLARLVTAKAEARTNPVALENIEGWTGRWLETNSEFEGEGVSFRAGDILFGKLRPYLAKVHLATADGEAVGDFHVLRPDRRLVGRFLQYNMLTSEFIDVVNGTTFGSKMPRVSWDAIGAMPICVPPVSEQHAIAAFLDRETAKIDALVAEQERLIELLEEKRSSVVASLITKGIATNTSMRDSGHAAFGEIPAHWDFGPIGRFAKLESGHTPSRQRPDYWQNCRHPWFSLSDVWQIREAGRDYIQETKELISDLGLANSAARLLPAGTVMLSRTASVGFAAIMASPMATTQDFANWICGPGLRPEYLLYVLRSMEGEFRRLRMGSVHNTIYMPDIRSLCCPVPPVEEQEAIVTELKARLTDLERLGSTSDQARALLVERRRALISAAVTGQIDVRGLVAA